MPLNKFVIMMYGRIIPGTAIFEELFPNIVSNLLQNWGARIFLLAKQSHFDLFP